MNVYDNDNSQANPVLRDLKFRQAISWAVDKQKIVDTALSGYGAVGQSIIGPFTDGAWTPSPEETFGYDMAKAAAAARRGRLHGLERRRHQGGQEGQAHRVATLDPE